MSINPNLAEVHYNYGVLLRDNIGNFEKAIQYFENAFTINPNFAEAHFNYALLIFADKERAKKHYLKAILLNPSLKNEELDSCFAIK